jgi:hypothetical protein
MNDFNQLEINNLMAINNIETKVQLMKEALSSRNKELVLAEENNAELL